MRLLRGAGMSGSGCGTLIDVRLGAKFEKAPDVFGIDAGCIRVFGTGLADTDLARVIALQSALEAGPVSPGLPRLTREWIRCWSDWRVRGYGVSCFIRNLQLCFSRVLFRVGHQLPKPSVQRLASLNCRLDRHR